MSRAGREWAEDREHDESTAPRTLARIRAYLRRRGVDVRGDMFVEAIEALVKREAEASR